MTDYAAAPALLAAAQETIRQLADENAALLAANTRLRGERDRARDLAVRSGIFEGATPATLRAQERLEWEQPEPDDDVIGVTDYTGPVQDGDDSVTWGRVHRAGEGGEHSEWKGYKDGNKVYLDWPELVRRWGPITPTMRSLKIHDPGIHQPFDDDGVDYCGWRGDDGIHGGCGELWPCSSRGGAS